MLDLVGLAHAAKRAPHQLSGGQQQRIALARALAPQPRLLLLDEPFSSLDVDLREHLAQELRAILKASGTTALFVTHDQMEAFALGDAIGVMNAGRLEQWGDAYTLYHRPASRFVARFIGHGVFTPAEIVACAHGPCVHTPFGELDDPAECPLPSAYPGGQCDLLLRADDVVHDDDSPVKAQIERKAFRGSEFLYTLRLATRRAGAGACALAPRPRAGRVDRHPPGGRPCRDLPPRNTGNPRSPGVNFAPRTSSEGGTGSILEHRTSWPKGVNA